MDASPPDTCYLCGEQRKNGISGGLEPEWVHYMTECHRLHEIRVDTLQGILTYLARHIPNFNMANAQDRWVMAGLLIGGWSIGDEADIAEAANVHGKDISNEHVRRFRAGWGHRPFVRTEEIEGVNAHPCVNAAVFWGRAMYILHRRLYHTDPQPEWVAPTRTPYDWTATREGGAVAIVEDNDDLLDDVVNARIALRLGDNMPDLDHDLYLERTLQITAL